MCDLQLANKNFKLYKVATLFFLCAMGLTLIACDRAKETDIGFFTTVKLNVYYEDESLVVQYPSGERAVHLPIDDATRNFPAISNTNLRNGDELVEGVSVFYGKKAGELQWAVVCGDPSAGTMPINVLLSEDSGKSWEPIVTAYEEHKNLPSYVVIGAGFQSAGRGFLCYRHTMDEGPEIYMTMDGGGSWERLDIPIPQEFNGYTMDPYSPIITDQSVSFPVVMNDERGFAQIRYLSSLDFVGWKWTSY